MTYAQVIKEAIGSNQVICTIGQDRKIGIPLIQYNETDWEFAKRLASHFNKPIQSDILTGNPRIWFGVRFGNESLKEYEKVFRTNTYNICISSKYYEVGKKLGLSKTYYITYKIKDGTNLHIGDKILFKDKKLIICEKEVKFEKGELVFYYTLAREEYVNVVEYYNQLFTGLTLLGEVIKTSSEKVWLKLDIDGKNGEYDYKWKPTSGSLMYCMPKIGTKASLYFESADERSGIATNSPRTNGGNDEKSDLDFEGFSNVQNRGMVTEHNKRMDMYPSTMKFSGTSNTNIPLEILFDDEIGIKFESNKILDIVSLEGIKIEGNKNILGYTPLETKILRTSKLIEEKLMSIIPKGTYTMSKALNDKKALVDLSVMYSNNDTTLMISNQFDIYSYKNHLLQGREYETYPPFDDAPEEASFNWGGWLTNLAIGAIATVALVGLSVVTGGLAAAAFAGAAVAVATTTVVTSVSDLITGEVTDTKDFVKELSLAAVEGAITGMIGVKIPNPKLWQGAIIDGTMGMGRRTLETMFDPNMSFGDKMKQIFNPTAVTSDIVGGALSIKGEDILQKGFNKTKNQFSSLKTKYKPQLDAMGDKLKKIKDKIFDPVDAVTGSFLIEQCDLIINDILEDFAIERFYESTDKTVSLIGKGWHLSIFSSLKFNNEDITVILPNNKIEIFTFINNEYKSIRNEDKTLELKKIETNYILYNSIEKTKMIYKENGLLLYVIDKNGNEREYIYENDILKRINFASGQYFDIEIKENKIRKITDNINRQIKYEYDGDYLISVEIPNEGIEKYKYNDQGVIEDVINANGIKYVTNEYDDKNRVIYQKLSTGQEYRLIFDDKNKVNTFIMPKMNRKEKYFYNSDNLVTKIEYEDGTYEEIKYDMWQNIIYEKDRLGNEKRYVYNKKCLKLEEHLPNGLSIYYEYDENDNLIKEWDNSGKEHKYTYDEKGNVIKSVGKIDEEKDLIVLYEYDNYGRIVKEIDPEGREKIFEYNFKEGQFNKPTKYITSEENQYLYTYDKAGRCINVNNGYGIKAFEYDQMDIMTKEIDQLGNTTLYKYDQMFNLKKVVLPNNIEKEIGTSYEYDPFHKLLKTEDAEGNVYATPRDYEGNLLKEINPNSYSKELNDGEGISYKYDEYDNKIKTIYPDGGIEGIKYDANGNIIKIIAPEQYDEKLDDGAGYTYEYDCMNRLIKITDPRYNVIKKYVYDLKGNVIKEINGISYKTGSNDEERKGILYKYNKMNWLIEKREPITKTKYSLTTYEYDLSGNVIKENRYIEHQTEESYQEEKHTIAFTYDKDNRRIKVSDCTGAVQEYSYNIFNKVSKERRKINNTMWQEIVYNYDNSGGLIEVKRLLENEVNAITKYYYDKNGNITKIKTPLTAMK